MSDTRKVNSSLTISILSSQCLVWFGLQKILESSATIPMVVHPLQRWISGGALTETRVDVFILDLETVRDAIGTIKQIRESAPNSKIVLLCGLEDNGRTCEAFVHGVDGILLKVQPPGVMLATIEAMCSSTHHSGHSESDDGILADSPNVSGQKVEGDRQQAAWPDSLTEREREIIRLVGQGLSNKEIAYKLSISHSTVRHHMTNIFDKVGVANRQKLLVHAHQFRSASAMRTRSSPARASGQNPS